MGQVSGLQLNYSTDRTLVVETDTNYISLNISNPHATVGWLLSEVIRQYTGEKTIVALKTSRAIDIKDWWLTQFNRSLHPFASEDSMVAVYREEIPSTPQLSSYIPLKIIGRGAFSEVILARKRDTGELLALKSMKKQFLIDRKKITQTLQEREIHSKFSHPFILNLQSSLQTESNLYLVTDFCPGGEFFYHIQKIGKLSEDQARFYVCEIILGLEYLHSLNIVYRDLKPENVLLDVDGHVKIADFGAAKVLHGSARSYSFCGSAEYMPPEMINKLGHGKEVDFYCLGAFLFEMLVGLPPFYDPNPQTMQTNILHFDLSMPKSLSKDVRSLLRGLLEKDSRLRLGAFEGTKEIKQHPWLASVNWNQVYCKNITPPFVPSLQFSNLDPVYTDQCLDTQEFNSSSFAADFKDPFYVFSQPIGYKLSRKRKAKVHSAIVGGCKPLSEKPTMHYIFPKLTKSKENHPYSPQKLHLCKRIPNNK